jgi:sugar transferase (PEP-CTERM/EpsH1 system associated)
VTINSNRPLCKKPLVVLHVILSLEIGGMEQIAADLITHLDHEQFTPVVACLESLGPIAAELTKQGIVVVQIKRMTPVLSFAYPRELMRLIRDYHINAVHVHSGCWHKAALAARLCGIRNVIYTEHGRIFPDSRAVIFLDRLFAPLTRHVVAVSDNLAEYMCSVIGLPKKKVSVIVNGIDVDRFQIARCSSSPDDSLRIGIIARLAPVKDIATLVRAMAIVHKHKPKALLSIVGDGPERDSLESLVKELGLASVISFFGFRRDIPEVLQKIDIFVLSSLSEGTSITLLEAMASGKPVVVTNVGGNPAIVEHGVNGFLVPAGEADPLAQALLKLSSDAELRRSMAAANINKATAHYSIQSMVRHYENLYLENVC